MDVARPFYYTATTLLFYQKFFRRENIKNYAGLPASLEKVSLTGPAEADLVQVERRNLRKKFSPARYANLSTFGGNHISLVIYSDNRREEGQRGVTERSEFKKYFIFDRFLFNDYKSVFVLGFGQRVISTGRRIRPLMGE